MRRRRYLAALGAGASGVLAGCSESGGESTTAGATTGTPTEGTATPAVAEAFELTQHEGPGTTRLNEPWVFGFSVRNVTDARRPFRSTLSTKLEDREWEQLEGEVSFEVDPGTIKTWQSPRFRLRFLRTVTYRLDALGATWRIQSTPLQLDYGLAYTSPVGLRITVGQVTFRDDRPEGGTATPTPTPMPPTAADAEGTKWAVVPVDVENPTDRSRPAPFPQEFTFRGDGETYPPEPIDHPNLLYRERALETDESLSGDLFYEVPADLDPNAVEIVLRRSYDQGNLEGEIEVVWDR